MNAHNFVEAASRAAPGLRRSVEHTSACTCINWHRSDEYILKIRQGPERARVAGIKEKGED